MKNIYPISFDKIRLKNLKSLLQKLMQGFETCGIDNYLIGALARDMHMSGLYNYTPPRATQDIDFAVLVNDDKSYEELFNFFIKSGSFEPTDEPYRLKYEDGKLVDLLPFGRIETPERTALIGGRKIVELFAIGLQENLEFAETFTFEDGFKLKVTSLSGVCLLKFIAWAERPLEREKDIQDVFFILEKYADIFQDEIFEKHDDLLETGWPYWLSARLLGRHLACIIRKHNQLKKRITDILIENLTENSELPILFTRINRQSIIQNMEILKHILQGINECL